jgi:hypothetical protein
MEPNETQGYVEHRLRRVVWKGDPAFDSAAYEAIHHFTGGLPRRINLICNRLMLAAYLGEKHAITAADVRSVSSEMRQELGPETVPTPLAASAQGARPAANLPVPVTQSVTTEAQIARLEDRISRLERLLHSTVSLLHTLIERDQRNRRSG